MLAFFSLSNGYVVDLEAKAMDCSGVSDLFTPTIPEFGSDCTAWSNLFATNGKYYHAHAGYHTGSNLTAACTGYAGFCPENACSFQIAGKALITPDPSTKTCHALVPYLWSQDPAQADNLEPHNGWEYMIAKKNKKGKWRLVRFSEIETTFSVPFDWASPNSSETTWRLDALEKYSQAQKGECDNAVQPFLTNVFDDMSKKNNTLYRQQGNAVALAAGGICQLVVPYAASVPTKVNLGNTKKWVNLMEEGHMVFTLAPTTDSYESIVDEITFKSYQQSPPPKTCQNKNYGQCNNLPCCNGLTKCYSTYSGCLCKKSGDLEMEAPVY